MSRLRSSSPTTISLPPSRLTALARAVVLGSLLAVPLVHLLLVTGCADREVSAGAAGGGSAPGAGHAGHAGHAGQGVAGAAAGASATSSASASAGAAGSLPADNRDDPACLAKAEGIALFGASNPTGAPAFALASCRLAYLAADGSLRDRDLLTGVEITVAEASALPSGPARSADLLAWDALAEGSRRVHVRRSDGQVTVVPSGGKSASEAQVFDKDVVFTIFAGAADGDADVALWESASGQVRVLADGPAQQRFPAISRKLVAYADFREGGEQGRFDAYRASLADIVVIDRASGVKTVRALPGKQAFPMLDPELDLLGYLQWDEVRPEPKLGAPYGIRVGSALSPLLDREVRAPDDGTSVAELRPSFRAGSFAWLERHEEGGLRVLSRPAAEGSQASSHVVDAEALASSPLAIGGEVWLSLRGPTEAGPRLIRLP